MQTALRTLERETRPAVVKIPKTLPNTVRPYCTPRAPDRRARRIKATARATRYLRSYHFSPYHLAGSCVSTRVGMQKKSYFFVLGNTNFARERGKLDQAAGAKPHRHDAPHNPNQLTRASAACVAEAAPRTRVQPPDVTGPGRYDGSLEASVGPFPPFPPLLGGGVRRTFRDRPGSKGGKEDGNKFRHYPITGRCGVLLEAPAAAPYFSSLRPPPVARLRAKHRVPAAAQQTGFERSPVPRAPRGGWRSTGPCFILDRGGRSPFFPHISFR